MTRDLKLLAVCRSLRRRKNHCVDDVDHTVSSFYVCQCDFGVTIQGESAVLHFESDDLRVESGRLVESDSRLGGDISADDVVGQNIDELILVLGLQQGLDGAFWQLCEGLVCRSEDREGTVAFESIHETGCFQGRSKSLEGAIRNCGIDDVLFVCTEGDGAHGEDRKSGDQECFHFMIWSLVFLFLFCGPVSRGSAHGFGDSENSDSKK